MIQLHKKDSIVDLIEKIDNHDQTSFEIHIPKWHSILFNLVSLRILDSKIGRRNILIVTPDEQGKKNLKKIGIQFKEEGYRNLTQYNYNIYEYIKYLIHLYISKIDINSTFKKSSLFKNVYILQKKQRYLFHIIFLLFLSSLILFFTLYYFIFVKTEIIIYPELRIHKESLNFTLKENNKSSILEQNNTVTLSKISEKYSLEETYRSNGVQKNEDNLASGKIRIFNRSFQKQSLISGTRFMTPEWIIFKSSEFITIPEAVEDNFQNTVAWYIDINVYAATKDINNALIWSNANIANHTDLSLPALWEDYQNIIFAKSIEDFNWGTDDIEKYITKEDIEAAKKKFEKKIKNFARIQLENKVQEQNTLRNTPSLQLIVSQWALYYHDLEISLWESIGVWSLEENFNLSWDVQIDGYVYDSAQITQKLKSRVHSKILEGVEKIAHIDNSSLSLSEIIYNKTSPYEIKANFEIDAVVIHDFLHEDNTYMKELLSRIQWLDIGKAEKILINDNRISHAEIFRRPPFLKNIPQNLRNIQVTISEKVF